MSVSLRQVAGTREVEQEARAAVCEEEQFAAAYAPGIEASRCT